MQRLRQGSTPPAEPAPETPAENAETNEDGPPPAETTEEAGAEVEASEPAVHEAPAAELPAVETSHETELAAPEVPAH